MGKSAPARAATNPAPSDLGDFGAQLARDAIDPRSAADLRERLRRD